MLSSFRLNTSEHGIVRVYARSRNNVGRIGVSISNEDIFKIDMGNFSESQCRESMQILNGFFRKQWEDKSNVLIQELKEKIEKVSKVVG